ncbi:hypothetical protein ABIA70_002853 [Arthrobacter sp. 754]
MVYLESTFRVLPRPVDDAVFDHAAVDDAAGRHAAVDGAAVAEGTPADGLTPIGWQAREIIDSILKDRSPGLDEVHWRLRRNLAAHPGSPELALLAHLMETTELVNRGTD